MNVHKDHTASCLCCIHLETEYEGAYSDLTPGAGYMIRCGKRKFDTLYQPDGEDMHRLFHDYAPECDEFEGAP